MADVSEGEAVRPSVYEVERDRHGLMFSGPLEVGECIRVVPEDECVRRVAQAREEAERLRSECAVCEKCGHVQAEPNWCHECSHRVTWPEWAAKWEADIRRQAQEGYWAADEVLEALEQHYIHNTVCGDFKLSIKVLERRFSGEGAS